MCVNNQWMFGVLADSNIKEIQRDGRLKNLKKCYNTECYEQCYNGPDAGVVNWDPGNEPNEKGVRSRKYNEGKYYESVCGKVDPTIEEEGQTRVCCMAMTPKCLACKAGIAEAEYLKWLKRQDDAEDVEDAEDAEDAEDVDDADESDCSVHIEQRDKCNNEYEELNNKCDSEKESHNRELNTLKSRYYRQINDLKNTKNELKKKINDLHSELGNKTEQLNETKKQCSIKHNQLLSRISQLNNTIASKSNCNQFENRYLDYYF